MATTFYVQASADPSNLYALCSYYTDPECQHPVDSPLSIPQQAGGATFQLLPNGNSWQMVGAIADRIDTPEIDPTLVPASSNAVTIPMPTSTQITKGVVLVFTSTNVPSQLYASADPQVTNNDA